MKWVLLSIFLGACATPPPPPAAETDIGAKLVSQWRGTIYVGDHMRRGVVRAQSNDLIPADDDRFSNMICIPYPDFTDLLMRIKYLRGDP